MATASEASQQANRSGMDPKRLVVMFYLVSGIILSLFLGHILELIWVRVGLRNPELEGLGWTLTSGLGVALALGAIAAAYLEPRARTLSLEVAKEIMKVTWPSWAETRVSTVAVVVASIIASFVLYAMDIFSYALMVDWLPTLWGKL